MSANVVIVGGGEVGTHLAELLSQWGYRPTLVEHRAEVLPRLRLRFGGDRVIEGNGIDPEVLETAGAREAPIVAAVTGQDDVNFTVAAVARFEFGVARTVARVNVPSHAWLFNPVLGVDVGLNQAEVLAHLVVEEVSTGDMLSLLRLGGGQYLLVEARIALQAVACGQAIMALSLPENCFLIGILRKGEVLLARGPTVLEGGDCVLALVHHDSAAEFRRILEGGPSAG